MGVSSPDLRKYQNHRHLLGLYRHPVQCHRPSLLSHMGRRRHLGRRRHQALDRESQVPSKHHYQDVQEPGLTRSHES